MVLFRAQWDRYIEQGGEHDLRKAIGGSAAVDLKDLCSNFNEIIDRDKMKVISKGYRPRTIPNFAHILHFIAHDTYGLHAMGKRKDSVNVTKLRVYMIIVLQVVKTLPWTLAEQLTRKIVVDKFLSYIPSRVCGDVKNVVKDYIVTYYAARLSDKKLESADSWNLLFTVTIMKAFLAHFQEQLENYSSTRQSARYPEIMPPLSVATPSKRSTAFSYSLDPFSFTPPSPGLKAAWSTGVSPFNSLCGSDCDAVPPSA